MKKAHLLTILLLYIVQFSSAQERVAKKITVDTIRIASVIATTTNILYVEEGEPAPSYTIYKEDGIRVTSEELKGKTVVLNFWITSCGPCRKELKRVETEILPHFPKDKFIFLAVGANETPEKVKRFAETTGLTMPLYYDPNNDTFDKFSNPGCPRNYVIDPEGILRLAEEGYNEEKFQKMIEVIGKYTPTL